MVFVLAFIRFRHFFGVVLRAGFVAFLFLNLADLAVFLAILAGHFLIFTVY